VTYVVVARWTAARGHEDAVAAAIEKLSEPSRREAGCLRYLANRSLTDHRLFLLYEEYADEDAYRAHTESEHFVRFALGEGIPLLESREREFFTTFAFPVDEASSRG
jgi:quinol monooxygenase YgiN